MKELLQILGRALPVLSLALCFGMRGQEIAVEGKVVHELSRQPVTGARVLLEGHSLAVQTDREGVFFFPATALLGEQVLVISSAGFLDLRVPVTLEEGLPKKLGTLLLAPDLLQEQQQTGIISLSEQELDGEEGSFDNVSGLLYATRDVFLNAAAFDFGQTFFRPRGLNSEDGKLLINGIEMNKLYNGRPQWSTWGGLNDVQRNQAFSFGLAPSESSFGGLAGTTNIVMRASEYAQSGKFSYATSNRSYTGRAMGSYSSGLNEKGWAYVFSVSRRFGNEGFREGSLYDANSFFAAVEKIFSQKHSLNFTTIFTPNRRGKTSANTQEVIDLKGIKYNSFWGLQQGEIRNSRVQQVEEPILMLNHSWKIGNGTELRTNLAYQFGSTSNSRLDYGGSDRLVGPEGQESFIGGGSNPDPAYYQKLPSYFLRLSTEPNYREAYLAEQEFLEDGQIDWNSLYLNNRTRAEKGGNAMYILYDDVNEDRWIAANSLLRTEFGNNLVINAKAEVQTVRSRNYARVKDLLSGTGYLDVDSFSEGDAAQNNLLQPNRVVQEGDTFKYLYDLDALVLRGFGQLQYFSKHLDLYASAKLSQTTYQRTGHYQNGNFPENSLGESEQLNFLDYGGKAGLTYKLTGRHIFGLNAGYFTRAPNLRNSFSNSRQNNDVVIGLRSERIASADASYHLRLPWLKARLTGYATQVEEGTEISFYYADGISGLGRNSTTAFVQEVLTGIGKRYLGGELGIETQVIPDLKLKAAAGVGEFIYSRNPSLYLSSDDFDEMLGYGEAQLINYKLAGGPQKAFQLGFEYRDPKYWFLSASVNYFADAYLDVAPLTRTRNFATDADGLPLLHFEERIAKTLLKQEKFDDYFLVNAIGGKTWKIRKYYIGFFASINNLLDQKYKTGGYEQARNANYNSLKEDMERERPIFGPKYWYGMGTNYYAHIYIRF